MIDQDLKKILKAIGSTSSGEYLIEYLETKIKKLELVSSIDQDDFEISGKVNAKVSEVFKEMCLLLKKDKPINKINNQYK